MHTKSILQKGSEYIRQEYKKIFGSQDGKIARELNKIAKYKEPQNSFYREPCASFYQDASPEDLKLIMSKAPEDFLKRCTYVNPKNLKEYNILLKSKNADGTLTVKVLDTYGKFIKECQITPQKVVVLDNFTSPTTAMMYDGSEKIPHGEVVKRLILKSNPFNDYEFIDACESGNQINSYDAIKKILERVKNGEKIDAINGSYAREIPIELLEVLIGKQLENKPMIYQKKVVREALAKFCKMSDKELIDYFSNMFEDCSAKKLQNIKDFLEINKEIQIYDELSKLGVKVFIGSGNGRKVVDGKSKDTINMMLFSDGVQGVGALDYYDKAASYSASRKTIFTSHYEKGDLCIEYRDNGFNFVGGAGIDIPYSKRAESIYNKIKSLDTSKIEQTGTFFKQDGIPAKIDAITHQACPSAIIINGTSWATPRRVGEYTKYLMFKEML